MDLNNHVIKLCIQGTRAEFQGEQDQARELYQKAWDIAADDFEACIAAHYLGHLEDDPKRKLHWDEIALEKADSCENEEVKAFYPSIYLSLGRSHELLGNQEEAQKYYDVAADLGVPHHGE
jgi:tetratricopeptide (TPR) repeat protein